jgi:hypothetical protein
VKVALLLTGLLSTACGRIDFGPLVPNGPHGDDDGGDGPPGDGRRADATPDAMFNACAAGATMIHAGVMTEINTCVGPDVLDGCGPAGTKEAILEFIPPASDGYNARAYDHGTMNISMVSTTVFDSTCGNGSTCAAFLGTTYTMGVPAYFVLEASSGGCADVDFLVD